MNGFDPPEDHRPVTWLHGHPIYTSHFIVLAFAVSMLATSLLMFLDAGGALNALVFSSAAVLHGQVWRVFTYGFVNPPSLWFVVDMFMIVWFGRELEKFFGRRKFLLFFGSLYLLSPVVFTAIGWWRPMWLRGETGAFAVFIAFATLYPNVAIFFNLLAKWIAWILVGLYTLIALSNRDSIGLLTLWITVGFAFVFVRYEQGRFVLPSITRLPRKPMAPARFARESPPAPPESMAEIDALLDKIARSGVESLTPKERDRLESARKKIIKKKTRR